MRKQASYQGKYGNTHLYKILQRLSSAKRWQDHFRGEAERLKAALDLANQDIRVLTEEKGKLAGENARLHAENQRLQDTQTGEGR